MLQNAVAVRESTILPSFVMIKIPYELFVYNYKEYLLNKS
jgi:ribosomal protein S19